MSNYFKVHKEQLYKIPDQLKDDKAILVEPFSCALGAINKVNIKNHSKILIVGAGLIGQSLLSLLKFFHGSNINVSIATKSEMHLKNKSQLPSNIK